MMYEPGERDSPVRDLAAELASLGRSANSVVLLAELGDQLIGYAQLTGGSLRRSRATAYLVIGVLAQAAGHGTGTALLRQARAWAVARGLHRLELTVMAHNTRAIRLYERMGFSVEGRRSECLVVDGHFIDELTMATLLPTAPATPLSLIPPPPLAPVAPFRVGVPGPICARCATGYVLPYPVGHRARNRGPEPQHFLTTRHTAPSRLTDSRMGSVGSRPSRPQTSRGPLVKTVKESRHPFVHVFLMAAQ
jgi:GNAT superfamily N-acetyltransferase